MATGDDFADALAASPLAGTHAAPIVLTERGRLSDAARTELSRLGCTRAIVVGGTSAVSDEVASALADMGISVERLTGPGRVETSLEIMGGVGGGAERVVVASGTSFADALSIASWCYATRTPILLVGPTGLLSDEEVEAIRAMPDVREAVVVGGTSQVGDVEGQLEGIVSVTRLAGRDRYDTCVRVADWAGAHGLSWTRVAVASGTSFPDALAGSALAGSKGAVTPLCSDASTDAATTLSAHAGSVRELLVFGGTSAVSDSLVTRLAKAAP